MAILILGGDSSIAKCYIKLFEEKKFHFSYTSRRQITSNNSLFFDLGEPNFEVFMNKEYDFVIFFASICNIDFCEKNKEESYLINVKNTIKSLNVLSNISKKVLFMSSNAVFDGKKPFMSVRDLPNPLNEYGRQKSEVEQWIKINSQNISILRLSKVIYPDFNLINSWRKELNQGNLIHPFDDMYLSPTPIESVIQLMEEIRINSSNGLFHCSGAADLSYYEFALDLFKNHANRRLIKKGFSEADKENSHIIYSSLV